MFFRSLLGFVFLLISASAMQKLVETEIDYQGKRYSGALLGQNQYQNESWQNLVSFYLLLIFNP